MNPRAPAACAQCSIGVEIDGGGIIGFVGKGARLPVSAQRLFTTVNDAQEAVEIHVISYSGGFEAVSIGRFLLAGIRRGGSGEPRIAVAIEIDSDGLIHALARDLDNGAEQRTTFPQTPARGEVRAQRTRVFALAHRLKKESGSLPPKDGAGLSNEVDELVARSLTGIGSNDMEEMKGCAEALETLLGEVRALRGPGGKAG